MKKVYIIIGMSLVSALILIPNASAFLPLNNGGIIIISDILAGFCNIAAQGQLVFNCNGPNATLYLTHGNGITIHAFQNNQTLWFNGTGSVGPQGPAGAQGPPGANTLDTIQNTGGGQASIFKDNTTSTNFRFKTISVSGGGLGVTNGSSLITITSTALTAAIQTLNGNASAAQTIAGTTGHIKITDSGSTHTIDILFKINNGTCANGRFSSFDNKTGNFVCTGGTGGVASLNGFQGNLKLVPQVGNTTILNNTGVMTVGLGVNPVITGGTTQTVTKQLITNSLKLGGNEDANSYKITNLNNATSPNDAVNARRLGLLGNMTYGNKCSDTQILSYQASNQTWICANKPTQGSTNGLSPTMCDYSVNQNTTDGNYYERNSIGQILMQSTTPETVIQDANNRNATVSGIRQGGNGVACVNSGYYPLSNSFTGFKVRPQHYLWFSPSAFVYVPNGYNGSLFIVAGSNGGTGAGYGTNQFNAIVDGGRFAELGTPQRKWTGIYFNGYDTKTNAQWETFQNMVLNNTKIGISMIWNSDLEGVTCTVHNGFPFNGAIACQGLDFNSNYFKNIQMHQYIKAIDMNFTHYAGDGGGGMNDNFFGASGAPIYLEEQNANISTNSTHINGFYNKFVVFDEDHASTPNEQAFVDVNATYTAFESGSKNICYGTSYSPYYRDAGQLTSCNNEPRSISITGDTTNLGGRGRPQFPNGLATSSLIYFAPGVTSGLIWNSSNTAFLYRISTINSEADSIVPVYLTNTLNARANFGVFPSTTFNTTIANTGYELGRQPPGTLSIEKFNIKTDAVALGRAEFDIYPSKFGNGTRIPLNFYCNNATMDSACLSLDTNNNIGIKNNEKLWFDGRSGAKGFMTSANSTWAQYSNSTGFSIFSNNQKMFLINGTLPQINLLANNNLMLNITSNKAIIGGNTTIQDSSDHTKQTQLSSILVATGHKTFQNFPNKNGTIADLSDIPSAGVTSLNAQTGAVKLLRGMPNMTNSFTNSSNNITWNPKPNIFLTNESAQTISKKVNIITSPLYIGTTSALNMNTSNNSFNYQFKTVNSEADGLVPVYLTNSIGTVRVNFGLFPSSGTPTNSAYELGRTIVSSTNWEKLMIAEDRKATGEFSISISKGGTGVARPLNIYCVDTVATRCFSFDTNGNVGINNNEKLWLDGFGSSSGFMKSKNSTYIQYSNNTGLSFFSGNTKMVTFNGTNKATDFGNSTMKLIVGSGSATVRNPASTFGYSLTGSAITKNITTTLPLATNPIMLSAQPIFNFTSPTNQTGTTSATPVMLGAFATYTPRYSGNATATISGYASSSLLGDGCRIDVRQSSTYMGLNGAALTGTLVGTNQKMTAGVGSELLPFSKSVTITGLTTGTKNFFDLSFAALTGGTCTIYNVDWQIKEQ